ncbi:TPA: response regulator [Burkholderia cenocepacia]|uniref:response regulator n=1 Tax=unclassified Burkholderia TaxID=2613784 RepID=UPI00158E52DD|nr:MULTISPECIES: response regulator [unclassified Burkholderia]HEF5869493.1 response regulator [Burkholderia cenocepacia]
MDELSVRVIVADDHPVSGHGIAQILTEIPTIDVAAIVSSTSALIERLATTPCDVLVLDYVMPAGTHGDGQSIIEYLQRHHPALRIVTVTMLNSPTVFRALRSLGVQCIVSKSDAMSHLVTAAHIAYGNGRYLSPTISGLLDRADGNAARTSALSRRESEIVRLFREGYKVTEIAEKLHRSKKTISAQKLAAMRKLGITRDADLIRYDEGIGRDDEPGE